MLSRYYILIVALNTCFIVDAVDMLLSKSLHLHMLCFTFRGHHFSGFGAPTGEYDERAFIYLYAIRVAESSARISDSCVCTRSANKFEKAC